MNYDEVKAKKKSGDLVTASQMTGLSHDVVRRAFGTPGHRYHEYVVSCLKCIISSRELFIQLNEIGIPDSFRPAFLRTDKIKGV